jgi:peptide/nickel transport system substrate-binding protein
MTVSRSSGSAARIKSTYDSFRRGDLSRRDFMTRATALGVSAAAATFLANGGNPAAAQSTPGASPAAAAQRPAVGTEGRSRGDSGELRILWWQAPTLLNPHVGGDTGSEFVLEPLLAYFPDASLQPILLQETPSVENGLLAEDLSSVTLRLLPDLVWSDGEPVTSADIIFTWQWVTNPSNASTSAEQWETIETIEAVDDLTAQVTFASPLVNWFDPFTGNLIGALLPAHAFDNDPNNPNDAFQTAPIGTGPYVLESFSPNDQGTYIINENYRDPNKPYFSRILVKGGGDAVAAGRSVVQVGDYDFAWNIQAEPNVIEELRQSGQFGQILQTTGPTLEALYINFSDPDAEVDGQRAEKNTPHPILTDPAVRQAINLGIDRALIAREFYGDESLATPNILTGVDFFNSPNTSWEFNAEKAAQTLDEAGWVLDGDVRAKDGVELAIDLVASVNSVRQKTQAVLKQNLESIGFKVDIPQIDSTVFFDTTPGNEQSLQHMYFDTGIWSSGSDTLIPVTWMSRWYAGPDGENIAQESNGWQPYNVQRYQSAEYDELYNQLRAATTEEEAQELLIALNDLLINEVVVVPIAIRAFFTAISNRLQTDNLAFDHPFVGYFWNLINWTLAEGQEPR